MNRGRSPFLLLGVIASLTPFLVGGLCNGGDGITTDTCDSPAAAQVSKIEIGHTSGDSEDPASFVPYQDNDVIPVTVGGQGSTMIVLRLRFTGQTDDCVEQDISVTDRDGNRVSGVPQPLVVDHDPQGRAVSHAIYLPGFYPRRFQVSSRAGGTTRAAWFEAGGDGDCRQVVVCEGECTSGPPCDRDLCPDVAPGRRAAVRAVHECLRATCGLSGDVDAGVPDGGAGRPCEVTPSSEECQGCLQRALILPEDCAAAADCGACWGELQRCDSISP